MKGVIISQVLKVFFGKLFEKNLFYNKSSKKCLICSDLTGLFNILERCLKILNYSIVFHKNYPNNFYASDYYFKYWTIFIYQHL